MFSFAATAIVAAAPQATTQFGTLEGVALSNSNQWLGIPFASPPTGRLRFEAPIDWNQRYAGGKRAATFASSECPQPESEMLDYGYGKPVRTRSPTGKWVGAEDCLYLNVWTPRDAGAGGGARRPVLLFVHGGAFEYGSGAEYNSSTLAAKHGAVVVTANYRLNDLGWAMLGRGAANFGLLDQRSAMRWVKANIGGFGGDPERILLFGESAGAISIALHLLTPPSAGLFSAALMESGSALAADTQRAGAVSDKYVALAGCAAASGTAARVRCLQEAPLQALHNASDAVTAPSGGELWDSHPSWGASVDGVIIDGEPAALIEAGRLDACPPFIGGVNSDEGTIFIYPQWRQGPMNASIFERFVSAYITHSGLNASAAEVVALYAPNASAGADNAPLAARVMQDVIFDCGTRLIAQRVRSAARLYRFDQRAADDETPPRYGVTHGSEVPFVFDHGDWVGENSSFTPAEEALAESLGSMWTRFASGQPPLAPHKGGGWPAYTNASDARLVLSDAGYLAERHPRARFCDFWVDVWTRGRLPPQV